jgi:transcription-repair coupling factor (superfamily II helicase)
MKISELKHIYDSSKQVQEIVKEISNPTKQLFLEGIAGSSIGFIGSSVFNFTGKNQLFICNDKETAAYFYNDFQSILGNEKVLFFPEAYKIPYKIEDTENLNVLIRTEVLQKISSAKEPYIIVTYPEALSEKVVSVQTISTKTINLKLNESLSIDFLNELLIEYHFERVDFVTDPGQYTIRGGIVDVFSFANDYPFRIEFFGDEIESIRTFDPENQLSLKQLESVKIIPNLTYTEEKKDRINFLEMQQ